MKTIITAALCATVLHLSGQNNLTEFEISYPKKSSRFPEEAIALWYSHTEGMYATDTIFIRCYEPKRINDELTTIQFERMEKCGFSRYEVQMFNLLGYPMKALSDRFGLISNLIQKADSLLFKLFPKLLRYGANANIIFTK
mgnify:CR=1 FL=1